MIELPLVFLGGLLGSAHCVGMCGGFALSIGLGSRGFAANLWRQVIYTAGRIFTYSFFGVVAGYTGFWLAGRASLWINAQATLSLVAGVLLAGQGLLALGLVPRRLWRGSSGGGTPCLAGTFVGPFLTSPRLSNVLLAGVFTGFLPCGLVYGYLALASSCSEHPRRIAHDVPLRRGNRPAHDPCRHRGFAGLAHSTPKPVASLGSLRRGHRADLDRPRDPVHADHACARSRSLPVLRSIELISNPVAATALASSGIMEATENPCWHSFWKESIMTGSGAQQSGSVRAIWPYPVKSMLGEELANCCDREWVARRSRLSRSSTMNQARSSLPRTRGNGVTCSLSRRLYPTRKTRLEFSRPPGSRFLMGRAPLD